MEVTCDGTVRFHVSISVDVERMKGWEADRITAFFEGIAMVLKAEREPALPTPQEDPT